MFRNYITATLRNLTRNPVFSLVNILGLSLGMASFLFIFQYINFEFSVNRFHSNLPQIYRCLQLPKEGNLWDYTPPVLGVSSKQQFAEVAAYCRVVEDIADGIIIIGEKENIKSFKEDKAVYADGSFFQFFSFPIIQGDGLQLFKTNSVALSRSIATKYFGSDNPIGKVIHLNNDFGKTLYTVVAVYDDFSANSDLQYDLIFSLATFANKANLNDNDWADLEGTSSFLTTYLMLEANTDLIALENKITDLRRQQYPDVEESVLLQPASSMHLGRSINDPYPTYGNLTFVYTMTAIAVLILLIAWLNYINLSTANSLRRAKEVGIRKTVGASKSQLVLQFLGESFFMNAVSFCLAATIVFSLQPFFNAIVEKPLSLTDLFQSNTALAGVLILIVGSIGSGAFGAFALSSFKPTETLKGIFVQSFRGNYLRKTLVVFQFGISIFLIASTLIMYQQVSFMQTKDLGLELNHLLVIEGPEVGRDSTYRLRNESFKNKISSLAFVERFSSTGSVPSKGFNFATEGITQLNPQPGDEKISYSMAEVDENFVKTYGLKLIAGNNFTAADCQKKWKDRDKLMMNERAAYQLGFSSPSSAIGQRVKWNESQCEVVGIVKDYHHKNLREAITPIIFIPSGNSHNFTVKLSGDDSGAYIKTLNDLYNEYFPGNPFRYFFVEDNYHSQYKTETNYSYIFTIASSLAIFIACLGLYGLTSFTVERRSKEIGIRKILGASVSQITSLLSRDFLILVSISIGLSIPLSWYFMDNWLQGFSYHITISAWIFCGAAIMAVFISFLTISFKTIRAALSNPVAGLKVD